MNPELSSASVLPVIASVLAACDSGYNATADKIAARVNGAAIFVCQIGPSDTPDNDDEQAVLPVIDALEKLIDDELLAQKAVENGLEQDPSVILEIEAAKQQILAKTYVDRSIGQYSVGQDEIERYYRQHPDQFEQRRSYRVNELVASVGVEHMPLFMSRLVSSHQLDDLVRWLQDLNLSFIRGNSIKLPEPIPGNILQRLGVMKDGQIAAFKVPGNPGMLSLIQVLQVQDASLSLDQASPLINELLLEEKRQMFAQGEVKNLRETACIEYFGAFAREKHGAIPVSTAAKPSAEPNGSPLDNCLSGQQ